MISAFLTSSCLVVGRGTCSLFKKRRGKASDQIPNKQVKTHRTPNVQQMYNNPKHLLNKYKYVNKVYHNTLIFRQTEQILIFKATLSQRTQSAAYQVFL